MEDPDQVFFSVEDYDDAKMDEPRMCFFAEYVAEGGRKLITDYSLKERNMLGTTSMDAEMSLIMANFAQVRWERVKCLHSVLRHGLHASHPPDLLSSIRRGQGLCFWTPLLAPVRLSRSKRRIYTLFYVRLDSSHLFLSLYSHS